jgi:hypothetical protein
MPFGNLAGLFLVVLGLGLWIIGYRMTDMEQEYDGIGFDKLREYVRKIGHEEVLYRWLHDAKERTKIEMLTYAYLRRHFISARMKELASKDFNEKALRNILNRKGEAIRKQSNAIRRQLSHKHDAVGGVQQPRNDKVPVSLSSLSSAQGLGFSEAREPIRPVGCSSTRDNDNLHTRDVDYHSSVRERANLGLYPDENLNYHEDLYVYWFGILRKYKLPTLVHAHRLLHRDAREVSCTFWLRVKLLRLLQFWYAVHSIC